MGLIAAEVTTYEGRAECKNCKTWRTFKFEQTVIPSASCNKNRIAKEKKTCKRCGWSQTFNYLTNKYE